MTMEIVKTIDNFSFHPVSGFLEQSTDKKVEHGIDLPPADCRDYLECAPQLQISMTDACNMRCTYCSFRSRLYNDEKPLNMPMQKALAAIDFFSGAIDPRAPQARIDFGLSGEPMLRSKTHPQLLAHAKKTFSDSRLEAVWTGTNTTNATLILEKGLVDRIGPPMDISCDGPKHVHDRFRRYKNGSGSYDDVLAAAKEILPGYPQLGVSAVLSAMHTDFVEIFLHLFDRIGFRNIYMKPVNVEPEVPFGLNAETLPLFVRGYSELTDYFLSLAPRQTLECLTSLSRDDFYMRFVYRIMERSRQVYRCGAGKSGVYVDTNGLLYPCAHFIGKSRWHIGILETGIEDEKRDLFFSQHVDLRKGCRTCWARYLCGGGCYYQAVLANGAIDQPDRAKCGLVRHLASEAIRLVGELSERSPEVLAALPAPYYIPAKMLHMGADEPWTPSARLNLSKENFEACWIPLSAPEGAIPLGNPPTASFGLSWPRLEISLRGEKLSGASTEIWLLCPKHRRWSLMDARTISPATTGVLLRYTKGRLYRAHQTENGTVRQIPHRPFKWEPVPGSTLRQDDTAIYLSFPIEQIMDIVAADTGFGLNLFLDIPGAGRRFLTRYEPFCLASIASGSESIQGGEFGGVQYHGPVLNAAPIAGFEPLTRWPVLHPNVC